MKIGYKDQKLQDLCLKRAAAQKALGAACAKKLMVRLQALEAAARQIADGSLGTFVNSHGGALVVHSVRDGVVEIAMEGACDHCPAAEITMHARFEHLLRRRCPWLVEVRRIDE